MPQTRESNLITHTSYLIPHTSYLIPHTSHLFADEGPFPILNQSSSTSAKEMFSCLQEGPSSQERAGGIRNTRHNSCTRGSSLEADSGPVPGSRWPALIRRSPCLCLHTEAAQILQGSVGRG